MSQIITCALIQNFTGDGMGGGGGGSASLGAPHSVSRDTREAK